MRIHIVSSYYQPEVSGTAPWVAAMAEELVRRGHELSVTTTFPHYPEWDRSRIDGLASSERRHGVLVRRRALYVPSRQTAAQRALYEASLLVGAATGMGLRRPDVVIAFVPTVAAASVARMAARVWRRPYGLIIHDLMGLGATETGVRGGRRVAGFVRGAEVRLARGAARVAILTEGFRPYFEQGGVAPDRIARVRLWSDPVAPTATPEEVRRRHGWAADDVVCVHGGNMGLKQGLENLVDSAALLDGSGVRIVLVGDGNARADLEASVRRRGLANVDFVDSQPSGSYEAILAAADVLLVNQRSSVGSMSFPSKLTSYFNAGRPVIAAVAEDSEAARELRAAGAGVVVPPEDPNALAAAIRELVADPAAGERFAGAARDFAAHRLRPQPILDDYERFVELAARG